MSVAGYFVKNSVISWMFTLILLLGGSVAFLGLGQLEDPPFTIKDAVVITLYPEPHPPRLKKRLRIR